MSPTSRAALLTLLLAATLMPGALAGDDDSGVTSGGDSDGAAMGHYPGTHLAFAAEGDRLVNVRAGGALFFTAIARSSGPASSDLLVDEAGYVRWQDANGTALGAAADIGSPGFRFPAGANTTFTLRKAPDAAVVDSPLDSVRISRPEGVAVVQATGAVTGGTVDALTWTFPEGGTLTLHFLLGNTSWAAAGQTYEPAVSMEVRAVGDTYRLLTSPPSAAALQSAVAGDHATFAFTLPRDGTVHAVRVTAPASLFGDVPTVRHVVVEAVMPEAPQERFRENFGKIVPSDRLTSGSFGPFYNVTRTGGVWDATFLLHAYGPATLTFRRDVTPPTLLENPRIENTTHQSLFLYTRTSEWGYVRLVLESGDHTQEHVTSVLSLEQTFPLQGLKPSRTYTYTLTAWDVAENRQQVHSGTFQTLAKPEGPKPRILQVYPPEDARLAAAPSYVEATFESPGSPVDPSRVRIFVNLKEVPQDQAKGLTIDGDSIRYTPDASLPPGTNVVSVEVMNDAGELAVKRWTFTVAKEETPAPGLLLLGLAIVAAALLARRR